MVYKNKKTLYHIEKRCLQLIGEVLLFRNKTKKGQRKKERI